MARNPSFFTLIKHATQMLNDRPEEEQDLIYYVCKLDQEERSAIILAYKNIKRDQEDLDAENQEK